MQILGWLCDGAPNKQIANELKIADGTVKVHIKTILKKIHMRNRTQAAVWAVNHGIAYGGGRGKAHTLIPGSAVLTERADAR
jgi:two-component system nitrate/nitrite response regulator NarL